MASDPIVSGLRLDDDTCFVVDTTDRTKRGRFDIGNVTTSTDRLVTIPDYDTTIGTAIRGSSAGIMYSNGSSSDADFVTMATKGDILIGDGTGAPQTLTVGTNNFVLTADSNETTGVKWAAAASGGSVAADDITVGDGNVHIFTTSFPVKMTAVDGQNVTMGNADEDAYFRVAASDTAGDEDVRIVNTNGTDEAAISITATAGGVDIDAAATKNVDISGGQVAITSKDDASAAISLITNQGTTETIQITNTQGTADDSIRILSNAGGVEVSCASGKDVVIDGGQVKIQNQDDASAAIEIKTDIGSSETIDITNTQGTSDSAIAITATAGGVSISPSSTGGTTISSDTSMYSLSGTTSATTADQQLWTKDVGTSELAYHVKAVFIGHDKTGNKTSSYEISGLFRHDGATTLTKLGTSVKNVIGDSTDIATSANIDLAVTGDDIEVKVTPATANTVTWKGLVTITSG